MSCVHRLTLPNQLPLPARSFGARYIHTDIDPRAISSPRTDNTDALRNGMNRRIPTLLFRDHKYIQRHIHVLDPRSDPKISETGRVIASHGSIDDVKERRRRKREWIGTAREENGVIPQLITPKDHLTTASVWKQTAKDGLETMKRRNGAKDDTWKLILKDGDASPEDWRAVVLTSRKYARSRLFEARTGIRGDRRGAIEAAEARGVSRATLEAKWQDQAQKAVENALERILKARTKARVATAVPRDLPRKGNHEEGLTMLMKNDMRARLSNGTAASGTKTGRRAESDDWMEDWMVVGVLDWYK